jgi:peptide-methionine (R)-S-oxide reductase
MESSEYKVQLSEEDWQKKLTQKQFLVLRKGETDAPFTGEYVNFHEDGL